MYFAFDGDNRVMICAEGPVLPGMVELVPPEGFSTETQADWKHAGEWIYDPLPTEEARPTAEERLELLEKENAQLKEALELLLSGETEENADG